MISIASIQKENFVFLSSVGNVKVFGVDREKKMVHVQSAGPVAAERLSGIKISQDWLQKFGFIQVNTEMFPEGSVNIYRKQDVFLGLFSNGKVRITCNQKSVEIEFLHQLQNFFLVAKGILLT